MSIHIQKESQPFFFFFSKFTLFLFVSFWGLKLQAIIALFSSSCRFAVNHRGFPPQNPGFLRKIPCRGEDSRRPSKDSTGSIRSKSSAAWWMVSHHGLIFFFWAVIFPIGIRRCYTNAFFLFFGWALAGQLIDSKVQWKVGSNFQDGQFLLKHDSWEQGLELQGISHFFLGEKGNLPGTMPDIHKRILVIYNDPERSFSGMRFESKHGSSV